MLKLTSYLSKLNLGRPSCGSFNQTFGLHTSPSLYFHSSGLLIFNLLIKYWMVSIIGANYSALKKRKSKADPGQVKAKEERRRRRLAKVCKILTSVLTDHLEKRIIFIRGNSIRFDLWEKMYFSYFFNESFYSYFRPSEKWKRRIGWQNHWWSVRFPSLCTRRGLKDWGRNIIG